MADSDNYLIRGAANLVNRLRSELLEAQSSGFNRFAEPCGDGEWRPLPDPIHVERMLNPPISETLGALQQLLKEAAYVPKTSKYQLPPDEFWTLGSMTHTFPIRTIHGGFVEPARRVPIVPRVPEDVVAFLLELPGERDFLERERHNQVGWHYHYLDFKQRRSNVVLCWDTRADRRIDKPHPLFQERQGEGHAEFPARPDLWGLTRKQSMHEICALDLCTWPLSTFRCASAKAGPVWPLSAKLTPIAKAAPRAPNFPAKKGRKGRR